MLKLAPKFLDLRDREKRPGEHLQRFCHQDSYSVWVSNLQGNKDTVAHSLAKGESKGVCMKAALVVCSRRWPISQAPALVKYILV